MDKINAACVCPNIGCELHGNCKLCKENHKGKSFCSRPKWVQNILRLIMPKEKTKKEKPQA